MDTAAILGELEAERDRLDTAIAALEGSRNAIRKTRRAMSESAKRKQSLAAKRRWRPAKKAGRNRL